MEMGEFQGITMLNTLWLLLLCVDLNSVSSLFPVVGDLLWNKILLNSSFVEIHSDRLVDCATECLTRRSCLSFNYKNNFKLCQLNNRSAHNTDNNLVKENGCIYSNIESWSKDWTGCDELVCPINYKYLPFNCSCRPSECGHPTDIAGASFRMGAELQNIGSTVVYQCKEGFVSNVDYGIAECKKNGSWSNVNLVCKVDCGKPPSFENSTKILTNENTTLGATVEYACNQGFRSTSAVWITCLSSGNWSSPSSRCEIITCEEPNIFTGAILNEGSNLPGAVRTYRCDATFKSFGNMSIVCQKNETWTLLQGSCKKRCSQPPDINYATAVSTADEMYEDSKYTYICQHPAISSGDMAIQCLNSGLWTSLQGSCIIDCGQPTQNIANSYLQHGSNTKGSVRHYICKSSFHSSGSGMIVCQQNGLWTTATLKCDNCRTMECSSQGHKYTTCEASIGVKTVVLKQQYSSSPCIGNYGIHNDGKSIYVKDGCRGNFQVCSS